jgi:hypothetical protein
LGAAITRKLLTIGFGRVGLLGDEPLTGAHGMGLAQGDGPTAAQALARWSEIETPWAKVERFRGTAIDRALDDMTRGFQVIVGASGATAAGQAVLSARGQASPAIAAHIAGKSAWCAVVPAGAACENCLRVPELAAEGGLYYPLLDFVAGWVVSIATEAAFGVVPAAAFVESVDATRVPWARETQTVEKCAKCSPPAS